MPELKLGLIGCGQVGKIHAKCMQNIEGAKFTAFCDIHENVANMFLNEFGGDYATQSIDRIIQDDHIDAVYICTRHDTHAPIACESARAGKHIFIEKPIALTLEECEQIAQAVNDGKILLMPGFKFRYYPLVRRAHEFIRQPQVIVVQMMDNKWPDDEWIQDAVQGGANVKSQGCHAIDLMRFLAGSEPSYLWAAGGAITHLGHPCLDQCVASISFANGHVGSWIQGDAGMGQFTGKFFVQLFSNNKSVQVYDRLKKATFFDGQKSWTEQSSEEEGYQKENEVFIDALRTGIQPDVSVDDGVQAARLVLAAERAVRTGTVQKFSNIKSMTRSLDLMAKNRPDNQRPKHPAAH